MSFFPAISFHTLCSVILLLLFFQGPTFGAIPQKCEEICQTQLDSIPLENFKREKILSHAERSNGILVEIKDNNLFIQRKLVTDEEVEAIVLGGTVGGPDWGRIETLLTLYKLVRGREVPDVLFLYTKCCCHYNLNWLKENRIPVLVGENCYLYEEESVINFIEPCSMSRSFWFRNNWSWEYAFQQIMESNNVISWGDIVKSCVPGR